MLGETLWHTSSTEPHTTTGRNKLTRLFCSLSAVTLRPHGFDQFPANADYSQKTKIHDIDEKQIQLLKTVTPLFFDVRPGVAKIREKIVASLSRPQLSIHLYSSTAGEESLSTSGGTVSGSCGADASADVATFGLGASP